MRNAQRQQIINMYSTRRETKSYAKNKENNIEKII